METGKFVEMLDELNRLKNEGVLDEKEYEKQMNKLKKQYSKESNNYYSTKTSINTNTTSQIVSLFLLVIFIIGGIWFFSSDIFKNLTKTGKKLINTFEDYTASGNSYNNSISGTNIYSNTNSKRPLNNSSSASNAQTQNENKKTYNVNVRKVAKTLTESIFKNNVYVDSKEVEKYALTVINYQTETNNSKVGGVKDGQEWVIVNMKFENKSDSTAVIDKNDFKIVDGAGRYGYRPYYKHLDTELDTIEIRAGKTATFSVRFVYYKDYEMFLRYNNIDFDSTGYGYIDIKLR